MAIFRGQTFATNTKRTYSTHLRIYLDFCEKLCIAPVPADEETVTLYAAYLARTRKPSTVRQYLNIVRLLHIECGLVNPMQDSWLVKSTLKGIERIKGCAVQRKTPITPEVLMKIKGKLRLHVTQDCIFWAACLVLFFGLLRKSNVFGQVFDPEKQLTRDSFIADENGSLTVVVRWSKTIQRRERTHTIVLPSIAPHPLCPVTAVVKSFQCTTPAAPNSQAFPMASSKFDAKLKTLAGKDYSSHSFRRGGATHALSCGIPGEVIKVLGDWQSNCYLSYLDQLPCKMLDFYRHMFAKKL